MKNAKHMFNSALLAAIMLLLSSCYLDSGSSEGITSEIGTLRELDVLGDDVNVLDIESYYSRNRYGPTQKIYHVKNQNSVVIIRIDNKSIDFEMSIVVYIFKRETTVVGLDEWINNQHSDGIYAGAAKPESVHKLSKQSYTITSSSFIDHTVGDGGDEYDNYSVEIHVDHVSKENVFNLKRFIAKAVVHVQTKDIIR